jgi:hypothetical protein
MNVEHLGFFHLSMDGMAPKTQRPCARLRDAAAHCAMSASGDPAMALAFEMASILPMVRASPRATGTCPYRPAAGVLLDVDLNIPADWTAAHGGKQITTS